MSVLWVRAKIECDGCGKPFTVALDAADETPEGWTVFDLAKDAVRGGHVEAERGEPVTVACCSVQDDKMLCPSCTEEADAKARESEQ